MDLNMREYAMILILGNPKKGPLIFRSPAILRGEGECWGYLLGQVQATGSGAYRVLGSGVWVQRDNRLCPEPRLIES